MDLVIIIEKERMLFIDIFRNLIFFQLILTRERVHAQYNYHEFIYNIIRILLLIFTKSL